MASTTKALFVVPLAFFLLSCGGNHVRTGPDERETRSVDLDKSERVRAEFKMGFGELNVSAGSAKLMDAEFTYNTPEWKPDVRYSAGNLVVEQRGGSSSGGHTKNRWDLRLNEKVPVDLRVEFGAGEAKLNVGTLNLQAIDIQMGAGEVDLDLRGNPQREYTARIRGGVGEATVRVPANVGVSAVASGALGDISVRGLRKVGERYVNEAFDRSGAKIRLDIQGGIGAINIISE